MVKIPMIDSAAFKMSIVLSNNEYQLKFNWNTRGEFWSMAILDLDDEVLIQGVKLVIGYPLLYYRGHRGDLPAGDFWCMDTGLDTMFVEPGRYDFVQDRELELIYIGDDE